MEEVKLCDYGCGQEANYTLKNGKNCCCKSPNSCPVNKEKNRQKQIGCKKPKIKKDKKYKCIYCGIIVNGCNIKNHLNSCYLNPINFHITSWNIIPCERCGHAHNGEFGVSGRFCSRSCSNKRNPSEETREKVSISLSHSLIFNSIIFYPIDYKNCPNCNKLFIIRPNIKNNKKYCSAQCAHNVTCKLGASKGGRASAAKRVKRSKNEILFANLCIDYFKEVKTNVPMFNGWDADVIIEDLKIAILWNGPWHYKDRLGKNHSLKQVRNRDKIKISEIAKAGYKPLVINDSSTGKYGEEFVKERFERFLYKLKLT